MCFNDLHEPDKNKWCVLFICFNDLHELPSFSWWIVTLSCFHVNPKHPRELVGSIPGDFGGLRGTLEITGNLQMLTLHVGISWNNLLCLNYVRRDMRLCFVVLGWIRGSLSCQLPLTYATLLLSPIRSPKSRCLMISLLFSWVSDKRYKHSWNDQKQNKNMSWGMSGFQQQFAIRT